MRAAGVSPIELVLPAGAGLGRDAGTTAVPGRAVHPDPVLRRAPDDGLAARRGVRGQPQARPAATPPARPGGDLPEAEDRHAGPGASDLPVSAARRADPAGRP